MVATTTTPSSLLRGAGDTLELSGRYVVNVSVGLCCAVCEGPGAEILRSPASDDPASPAVAEEADAVVDGNEQKPSYETGRSN